MEELNNFNGMLEVAAALDNASIHRLEATFKVCKPAVVSN